MEEYRPIHFQSRWDRSSRLGVGRGNECHHRRADRPGIFPFTAQVVDSSGSAANTVAVNCHISIIGIGGGRVTGGSNKQLHTSQSACITTPVPLFVGCAGQAAKRVRRCRSKRPWQRPADAVAPDYNVPQDPVSADLTSTGGFSLFVRSPYTF